VFGSGPSEEIRLESKVVQQVPPDEQESQARYDGHVDSEDAIDKQPPGIVERLKRWFSGRF
jgi:hypothetical protein